MYYIELNDASRYEVSEIIKETTTELKGVTLKALEFEVCNVDVATIRSKFMSEFNTRTIKLLSEQKTLMTVYNGYSTLRSIATNEQDTESNNYVVVMAQSDDVEKLTAQLTNRIKELEDEIIKLTVKKAPEEMELDELKAYLVAQSKINLETYLSAHTVQSDANREGAFYSCTLEKQTLLNNAIAMADIHEKIGDTEYQISYNEAGQPCTYDWTKDQLVQLAIDIESYVKPLISLQQTMENSIMTATTTEEAMAVVITFDTTSTV